MKNSLQQRNNEIAQLKQKLQTTEQSLTAKTNEANKAKQGLQTAINELRKQREEAEKLAEQILEVELSKADEIEKLNAVIADLQQGRRYWFNILASDGMAKKKNSYLPTLT